MNKSLITSIVVILIALGILGYFWLRPDQESTQPDPVSVTTENTSETSDDSDVSSDESSAEAPQQRADLEDVTGGASVRGIVTNNTSGIAMTILEDGRYSLTVTFANLPDPTGDDFYEGWVVRSDPFEAISTGKLENIDGVWQNTFVSETDLTDHLRYVLTVEPNDGDPAPADHILEGDFVQI